MALVTTKSTDMTWIWQQSKEFSNREGLTSYDFSISRSQEQPGVSAMVRVRNEETKIFHCLMSILPVFDEIVLVDNGSDDQTVDIIRRLADSHDTHGKIRLLSYPHRLARFGPEHDGTPEDSIRSAVYYTNWSLSHCRYRYVCKWDGDMVMNRSVREQFRDFLERIQTERKKGWVLAGQTVYRDSHNDFYLSKGEINREIEIFPVDFRCRFVKARHWERLNRPFYLRKGHFDPVCFYELKFTDEDEFSHWSSRDWPSRRKQREWENYRMVQDGQLSEHQFEKLPRTFLDDQIEPDSGDPDRAHAFGSPGHC